MFADTMRILLVTDTHGDLGALNDLARANSASAIIHAGDFGFYDNTSVDRLSDRELKLHIVHSDLSQSQKENLLGSNRVDQREFVRGHLPLSDLPSFLAGERRFEIPVYAVWGNHEDVEVVKRFYNGEYAIKGLHILHDQATFHIEGLHLFGIGGNFLMGRKLFQKAIAGGGGRVWSVFAQYLRLLETVRDNAQKVEKRILVSHVSSGKEPFITLMGIHTASDLIVSGHMDPPLSMVWTDFAIRSADEAINRVQQRLLDVKRIYGSLNFKDENRYMQIFSHLANLSCDRVRCGRGQEVQAWYRKMLNVNLPDVPKGYAILETDGDSWKIHSR